MCDRGPDEVMDERGATEAVLMDARLFENATDKSAVTSAAPLRVTIVQPALPKYRVPVFRELANRPGIDLRIVYGTVEGLANVAADRFQAIPSKRREWKLGGVSLMWHGAEWKFSSPQRSDVIVLRWAGRSVSLFAALLRARLCGVPVVLWGHGYSKKEKRWWANVRNWMASLATALVFYEPRTRDNFVSNGWDPCRLFVALNAIDESDIEAARVWWLNHPDELARFQSEQGLDQGPVILFVSRLTPENRLDLLVKATAELAREFPALKTVIIGNGSAVRNRLRHLADEMGLQHNVVFEDGVYDELLLGPWFLSASVFCYPANVGLSLIHALWYGLPVVTSDNILIQNPEIVALEPGVNGSLYHHEDVSSLVAVLRRIIADKTLREQMSQAARQTVESKFSIKRMVDGLEQAIRYASDSRPAR